MQSVDSHGGPPTCRLRLELKVDDSLTTLVISERPSGVLVVQFLAQNSEITSANFLRVGIDGEEVLHVATSWRENSPELPNIAGSIQDEVEARQVIEALRDNSKGARWLQIVARPYNKAVPAEVLREAMDDFEACRSLRKL